MYLLAEFIIHLSEKHSTFEAFKKVLLENGAEFSDSFIANLLRIIQHMKPNRKSINSITSSKPTSLVERFPALAMPNEPQKTIKEFLGEEDDVIKVENANEKEDNDIVADLMAQLEADAPSKKKQQQEPKQNDVVKRVNCERSRSKERYRSRSRRSRSRDRGRSRSRERRRSRSHETRRHRQRSNERNRRRSPDRNRRSRSRERGRNKDKYEERRMKRDSPELEEDPIPGKVGLG